MANKKGRFNREKCTVTLDSELLTTLRFIKGKSGLSMSEIIEILCLAGLKRSKLGDDVSK